VSSRDGALRLLRRIDDPRVVPLVRALHRVAKVLSLAQPRRCKAGRFGETYERGGTVAQKP
jgi:hypothetical protein